MERLFYFLYQYRAFFTFIVLELFCAWLVVENNQYQGAKFFNSSNVFIGNLNASTQNVRDYFSLRETNTRLAEENAKLMEQLEKILKPNPLDTLGQALGIPDSARQDSIRINRFSFTSAKIVNNSVHMAKNYLTINKGNKDGIAPGMAVISPAGIVGKVKSASKHFSVVTSVLHRDVRVSAVLKRSNYFGTIQWDGLNPAFADLLYIPRHVNPLKGDTILTSGYNSIFPEGIMIGTIDKVTLRDEALFYDLRVRLSQDYRKLSYVIVVKSHLKQEQDSLEHTVNPMIQ